MEKGTTATTLQNNIYLIAGLGNPGREYRTHRHNFGFRLVDQIADELNLRFSRMEQRTLVAKTEYDQKKLILAKPQTFMNLSGQAVAGLVRFYKIPLANLLVAFDDLDLPVGVLRLRPGGGAGGQKGMRSIIDQLGTQDFSRLRLGIGRPPGQMPPTAYVLQDFSADEAQLVVEVLSTGAEAALTFVRLGIVEAMNRYNGSLVDEQ